MQYWVGYVIFEHWGLNAGSSGTFLVILATERDYQPPILPNSKLGPTDPGTTSINAMIFTISMKVFWIKICLF